ncbi:MAG: hypothetical protein QOF11_1165, partial [Chloroflexota bacterium]|nr:hypothetical protein [Chloroflexota bacterium]
MLEWIRDGCQDAADDEYSRRITTRALHRRRLVRVRGHGATWTASITKAGREWLDAHATVSTGERATTDPDDLIRRVVDAGGRLVVGDTYEVKFAHETLVKASHHSPARPKGLRLELKSTGSWSEPRYEVVLVRHFDDLVDPVPVPVPTDVTRYHPAVKAFLAGRGRQAVTNEYLARAARILQALAAEAPRRGVDALVPSQVPPGLDTYRAREVDRADLVLRAPGGIYSIRVREKVSQIESPVQPPRLRREQASWQPARKVEVVSTGVIEVIVEGAGMGYSGDRFRDSKTITVEEKLPRIFRAIEIERLRSAWRDQEREREAADRRDRWETAMAEARVKYEEQARWNAFVARSNEWEAMTRHRRFLAAAETASAAASASSGLDDFLASAEQLLDRRDPIL